MNLANSQARASRASGARSPNRIFILLAVLATCGAVRLLWPSLGIAGDDTTLTGAGRVSPPNAGLPRTFYGLHIHRAVDKRGGTGTTAWPSPDFGAWRLWDAGVAWRDLEPRKGEWDFTRLDSCVALAERHRVEVLLPLALSPGWAAARPSESSGYGPGNASEPKDSVDWISYVRKVATRYKGRIAAYEIWNEPNLSKFYSGNMSSLLTLARSAYRTIKSVDPTCLVVTPSATGSDGAAWLDEYLGMGGGRAADVVGFHAYVGQGHSPEDMAELLLRVKRIAASRGMGPMSVWNTETGWAIQNARALPESLRAAAPPTRGALPDSTAAGYVARCYLLAWIGGVARYYWYAWDNYSMGLVEPDGRSEKLAGLAYGTIIAWTVGGVLTGSERSADGTQVVHFTRSDGRECTVVWRSGGAGKFVLPLGPTRWRLEDLQGRTSYFYATGPSREVTAGESPILLEAMP